MGIVLVGIGVTKTLRVILAKASDFSKGIKGKFPGNIHETQLFNTVQLSLTSENAWPSVVLVASAESQEIREQSDTVGLALQCQLDMFPQCPQPLKGVVLSAAPYGLRSILCKLLKQNSGPVN